MTIDEAIYCMQSYLPDGGDEGCYSCSYYHRKHEEDNYYTCCSKEAHEMAIEALKKMKGDFHGNN